MVTTMLDDLHYGRRAPFKRMLVGHNDNQISKPFYCYNLNRHIEIIEISGGDAAQTKIYTGPVLYGANDDLTPVTLLFIDVNGVINPIWWSILLDRE